MIGEGFFSKKQKKASRLLQRILRGVDPSHASSAFNLSIPGQGLLEGLISFLFSRKVGRQRV